MNFQNILNFGKASNFDCPIHKDELVIYVCENSDCAY